MTEYTLEDYIRFLQTGTAAERRNAAWMMGRQRDPRIIEPLIAAIPDEDADVRLRVTESLGNIKDEHIVPALIAALGEEEPRVRAQVALSLGNQRDYRALEPLIALLRDGEDMVRSAAAAALFHLPDNRAVMPLVLMMAEDPDHDTRYNAGRTLSQIGGTEVVNALTTLLLGEPTVPTKIRVAEILATLQYREAIPTLEALRDDDDEGVRETAEWALGKLGVN